MCIQWLCYSEKSEQDPKTRLNRFFSSLYSVLKRDARAVLQFYPESPEQAVLIAQCASKVGFAGGVVIDYPNSSKAKKYYLCLSFERSYKLPSALGTGVCTGSAASANSVTVVGRSSSSGSSSSRSHRGERPLPKSREWIVKKKERQRKQGKEIKGDSKYTGRRRPTRF